jgi:hypothetical protein
MPFFPDPPKPPDPKVTAAAQTATNIGTAIANNELQLIDQRTPYGSLTYNQTGSYDYTDPSSGDVHTIPTYEAVTELTPIQQQTLDRTQRAQRNLAGLANQQSGFLKDYLAEPATFDTSEIEGRLYDLGSQRLDPRFEQQREGLRTRLANQGVTPGSEAYRREMEALSQAENDAYNQLILQGRGQAFNEAVTQRNQPINEITALLSGSQVTNPNVAVQSPQGAATTDYAGLVNQNFAQQQQNFQQKSAGVNSLLGGLFGLGAAGIGVM